MKKGRPHAKSIAAATLAITLVSSVLYSLVRLIAAPKTSQDESVRLRGDYILMLSQCCPGLLVMFVPSALQRR